MSEKKKPKLPRRPSSFNCLTCNAKIKRGPEGFSWCKKCKHDGRSTFCPKCERPLEKVKGVPRCRTCEKETLKKEKQKDKKKKKPVDTTTLDRVQDEGRRMRRPPSGLPLPESPPAPRFPHQQSGPRRSMDEHVVMDDAQLDIELRRQFEDSPLPARFSVDSFRPIRDPVHYHQLDGTRSIVDREDLPPGTKVWARENGAKFALEKFSLDGGAKKKKKKKEKNPPPMPPKKKKPNNGDDEGKKKKGPGNKSRKKKEGDRGE